MCKSDWSATLADQTSSQCFCKIASDVGPRSDEKGPRQIRLGISFCGCNIYLTQVWVLLGKNKNRNNTNMSWQYHNISTYPKLNLTSNLNFMSFLSQSAAPVAIVQHLAVSAIAHLSFGLSWKTSFSLGSVKSQCNLRSCYWVAKINPNEKLNHLLILQKHLKMGPSKNQLHSNVKKFESSYQFGEKHHLYLYNHVLALLRQGTISAALPPCQAGKDGEDWDNPRQSRNGKVKLTKDSVLQIYSNPGGHWYFGRGSYQGK